MRGLVSLALVVTAIVSGCAEADVPDQQGEASDAITSPSVVVEGISSTFDKDRLMEDSFYEDTSFATADEIQSFLEHTVWGHASWLAKETITPVGETTAIPVSEAIVKAAQAHHINPVLLLARMQVEKGLVSPSETPPQSKRDFALGCHRPTAAHPAGLDPSVAPMNIQLSCGAETLGNQIQKARASQNSFPIGNGATTQDGVAIRPADAATSALYAYTPIEGTKAHNGNWLVWTTTYRFAAAIQAAR